MVTNTRLAAAIAAVLAAGTAGAAGHPLATPAVANSPDVPLYIAGSSAAKNAVLAALETGLCGGTYALYSSTGNTNFYAVSCTPSSSTGISGANGTNVFTIWYRDEGGSVTGALPIVSGSSINQLNLSNASGGPVNYTVLVSGSSATNGIDDSFGPSTAVMKEPVQFGITDVEPGALTGDNYPSAYKSSVYGTATASQLAGLGKTALFQQVFGIFVNTKSGGTFTAAEQASLSLSKAAITNILQGNGTDWSLVSDTSGNPVTTGLGNNPITIVNREQGSGSRTAASIYFTDDECNASATTIQESTGGTADYFSTGNVLSNANTIPGAITYASIDNAGSYANLTLVSIDGIYPTNLAAAQGQYDFWFEATSVVNSKTALTANQTSLISYLNKAFQTLSSAPHAADILAIPGKGSPANAASLPPTPNGSATVTTIYVNPFTRKANSCAAPFNSI